MVWYVRACLVFRLGSNRQNSLTGNTRVISQTALDHFRTSLTTRKDDPYSVLLRRNKLPMALLDDAANPHSRKVLFA